MKTSWWANILQLLKGMLPISIIIVLMLTLGHRSIALDSTVHLSLYALTIGLGIAAFFRKEKTQKWYPAIRMGFVILILFNLFLSIPYFQNIDALRIYFFYGAAILGTLTLLLQPLNPLVPQSLDNSSHVAHRTSHNNVSKYTIALLLLAITTLSLILRYWNLDFLDSYRDEDHHLSSARKLLENGSFQYSRGKLVTYCATFFIWLGQATSYHEYLHWGRIPSIIFGGLAAIPIYFLGRKVSTGTGIIAALLWATSPWAIGVSKNMREHAYYVGIIVVFILLFIRLLEMLTTLKKENGRYIILLGLLIANLMVYSFFIDRLSTLKVGGGLMAAALVGYGLTHLKELFQVFKKHKWLVPLLALFLVGFLLLVKRVKFLSFDNTFEIKWANTFLYPQAAMPVHWWQNELANRLLVYLFLFIGMIGSLYSKTRYYFVNLIMVLIIITGYYLFFDRYYSPKYIFYLLPYFIIVIAASLSYCFEHFCQFEDRLFTNLSRLLMGIAILAVFNPLTIKNSIINPPLTQNKALATTGLVHHDKTQATSVFQDFKDTDFKNTKIISSVYDQALLHEYPALDTVYRYKYKSAARFREVDSIMNANPNGWMILDSHRNGIWRKGFPKEKKSKFTRGNSIVTLVSNKKECQVYRWKTIITSKATSKRIPDSILYKTNYVVDLNKPFALSFWVKTRSEKPGDPFLLGQLSENGLIFEQSSQGRFRVNHGADLKTLSAETPSLNDGFWHHVIFYQFGGAKGSIYGFYIDGEKDAFDKLPVHKTAEKPIYINNAFNGQLKDMRLYYNMLNEDEIKNIFNQGIQATGETIKSDLIFTAIPTSDQ